MHSMANFSICACQHLRLSDLGTLLDLCLSAHMRKQLGTLLGFVHLGRTGFGFIWKVMINFVELHVGFSVQD